VLCKYWSRRHWKRLCAMPLQGNMKEALHLDANCPQTVWCIMCPLASATPASRLVYTHTLATAKATTTGISIDFKIPAWDGR